MPLIPRGIIPKSFLPFVIAVPAKENLSVCFIKGSKCRLILKLSVTLENLSSFIFRC